MERAQAAKSPISRVLNLYEMEVCVVMVYVVWYTDPALVLRISPSPCCLARPGHTTRLLQTRRFVRSVVHACYNALLRTFCRSSRECSRVLPVLLQCTCYASFG